MSPLRLVAWQLGATGTTVAACAVLAGPAGAMCALLGGLSATLPSLAFALRLSHLAQRAGRVDPASFLVGELIKVVSTVVLLCGAIACARWGGWLGAWWALLLGFVVALKTYLLAFLIRTKRR